MTRSTAASPATGRSTTRATSPPGVTNKAYAPSVKRKSTLDPPEFPGGNFLSPSPLAGEGWGGGDPHRPTARVSRDAHRPPEAAPVPPAQAAGHAAAPGRPRRGRRAAAPQALLHRRDP